MWRGTLDGNKRAGSRIPPWLIAFALLSACAPAVTDIRPKFGDGTVSDGLERSYYVRGKTNLADANFGLAVKNFGMALSHDPSSVKALNGMAASYDLLGRFDLATRYYYKALRIDPRSVQTINNLGYSYYLRGEVGLAIRILAKINGSAEVDSMVAGNFRLARSAAAMTRRDRCRPSADGGSNKRGMSRPHDGDARRGLRIVPINSRAQRLAAETNLPSSRVSRGLLGADGVTGPIPPGENARPTRWPAGACWDAVRRELRRENAAMAQAVVASSGTEPNTIGGAESRDNPDAGRNSWRGIEPWFDAMPKLFELQPELIEPIRNGNQNEPN